MKKSKSERDLVPMLKKQNQNTLMQFKNELGIFIWLVLEKHLNKINKSELLQKVNTGNSTLIAPTKFSAIKGFFAKEAYSCNYFHYRECEHSLHYRIYFAFLLQLNL